MFFLFSFLTSYFVVTFQFSIFYVRNLVCESQDLYKISLIFGNAIFFSTKIEKNLNSKNKLIHFQIKNQKKKIFLTNFLNFSVLIYANGFSCLQQTTIFINQLKFLLTSSVDNSIEVESLWHYISILVTFLFDFCHHF